MEKFTMRQIQWNSIRTGIIIQLFILCVTVSLSYSQSSLQSGDAYVRRQGNEWIMGTARAERRIRLAGGHLGMTSLRNKVSGKEYKDATGAPAEIKFLANGQDVSAPAWPWKLRSDHVSKGKQNEIQLDIELESSNLRVTKHYVIYPGTSVIREWFNLENTSDKPVRITELDFLHSQVLGAVANDLDFNYVTGGGNYNGSQLLKSEPMSPDFQRIFDSNGGIQTGSYSGFLPLIFSSQPRSQ